MAAAPVLLPTAAPPLAAIRAAASAALAAGIRRRPLRATDEVETSAPTILVVEPDERTRSLLSAGLIPEGFEVIAAASAEEALRYLSPERPLPALVFCEADLRGGDGFSLCGQIRADQRTADVPVVLLSRSPESFHRELAGGAGADQYLPKPLYLNDVVALARLMANRSSSAARFDADTATLPISQALRALLSGVRAGRIELVATKSWITFREGQVVDASFDGLRGEVALTRMLLFARGEYVVTFGPALTRATLSFSLTDLCTRTLPRLKRWEVLRARGVPLEAVLVVDFPALAQQLEQLPDEVNALVRLCDGHRTVRDVVFDSNLEEVTALEALTRLYVLGVVSPATASIAQPEQDDAPRAETLFEATGTVDAEVLKQLEAFRIQPVVEEREQKPSPVQLTIFARPEPAPVPAAPAEEPSMLELAVEAHMLRQVPAAHAAPAASEELERGFFTEGEITADLSPAVAAQQPQPLVRWPLVLVGLVAIGAALAVAYWPSSKSAAPAALPPVTVASAAPAAPLAPAVVAAAEPSKPAPVVEPAIVDEFQVGAVESETVPASEVVAESATGDVPAPLVEAIALYESGRYREATSLLEEITDADPMLSQAWLFLGLARFDAGNAQGAEAAAMKAMALEPKNGRALILLASIYLDTGKKEQARAELEQYLQLYPKGPFAREARQLLSR